jgi:hypothetical protein
MMPSAQHDAGDRTLRVLLVGDDASLEGEFRGAMSGVPDARLRAAASPTSC